MQCRLFQLPPTWCEDRVGSGADTIGTYSDYRADPGTTPKLGPGLPPHAQNHTFRETPPPPLTRNHARRAHRLLARPAIARTEVLGGGPWGPDGIGHAALNWV